MTASSGLPEDQVVNDFAFRFDGTPGPTEYAAMFDLVDEFYNVAAVTNTVGNYISRAVNRSATHELAAYHITAGPLGSPVASIPWLGPPTPTDTNGVPREVAAVLSFHADLTGVLEEGPGDTRPRARRRGRLFIGPLTSNAVNVTTPPFFLADALTLAMRENAVKLMDDSGTADMPWSVWSRADATLYPVIGGWTDNAPDTQRRRGPDATVRVTWG